MKIYQEIFPKNDFIYLILLVLGFAFFDHLILSSLNIEQILTEYQYVGWGFYPNKNFYCKINL